MEWVDLISVALMPKSNNCFIFLDMKGSSVPGGDGGHFALCALSHSLTALESLR